MMRGVAYLFVIFVGLGAVVGSVVLVWGITTGSRAADPKGIGSMLVLVLFWAWAANSVYVNYIKRPRERDRQAVREAEEFLKRLLKRESTLGTIIDEVKSQFALVGEPRYRDSGNPEFDTLVQLETHTFTISLFAKDGAVSFWQIKE